MSAARDPEVGDLGAVLRVEKDVLRLDVAMHDTARVGGFQRACHLDREGDGFGDREAPDTADPLLQRLPLDVLEHDERHAVVLPRVEYADDMRVLDTRDRARLAPEALALVAAVAAVLGEHLDRDRAFEDRVESQPDPRGRAGADLASQAVAAVDARRGRSGHGSYCAPRGGAPAHLPERSRVPALAASWHPARAVVAAEPRRGVIEPGVAALRTPGGERWSATA